MKINKKVIGEILYSILVTIAFLAFVTWTLWGTLLICEIFSGNIPEGSSQRINNVYNEQNID